jgi:quercetin dioxygenase-like cupin family protein
MLKDQITEAASKNLLSTHSFGGIEALIWRLNKGMFVPKHVHNHDHMSILISGKILLDIEGIISEIHAGEVIEVKAGKSHVITALEDIVWACLHNG